MTSSRMGRMIVAVAFAATLAGFGAAQGVKIGEKVPGDRAFKDLLNGDGRASFMELRGTPVLLDWWGNH